MISVAATTGLLETITSTSADPDQVLSALGLNRAVLANPEGFIPCSTFARLLEEATRATGDICFGLHFGERFNLKNIGPLTYVVLNSPTIAVADQHVARYLRLYNQAAKVFFTVDERRAYLQYVLQNLDIDVPRQENEYSMVIRLNTIRMMVGSQWAPLEVRFAHPAPEQTSEHLRIFRAPVLFGYATNTFVIDRDFLERQVPAADERLYEIMRRYLEQILEEMPPEHEVLASVRRAVAESMREGHPSITRVAKKIAMSPRTLQRQLKEQGMDFKQLVADTRRRFALSYLGSRGHTLTEIAFLLGYSEVSSFNRAFKRWTGSTLLAYRDQAGSTVVSRESVEVC